MEEENKNNPSPVTMILYLIDNDKKNPSQNWEIIPKKKYTIGRSKKEVDLPLNIKLLSRKHAELIYYNSETIMVKDLGSRNGTFINKLKIEPNRESFFTNKQALSFGNTDNEIRFFDNNEQNKEEVPKIDSVKSKDSDNENEEIPEKKSDINRDNENENINKNGLIEEVNTDIKHDIREEKSNYSQNNQRKERESNSGNRRLEERININSKDTSKHRELNRDNGKNNDLSISNNITFQNKKPYIKSDSHGFEYNSQNIARRSQNNDSNKGRSSHSDKSRSREKELYSRSRSGSRETLVQQSSREQQKDYPRRAQEISLKNKDNYSYDKEMFREMNKERGRERDRQRQGRDYYERNNKYKFDRDIEEDKYMMRKLYEDRKREEERGKDYYRKRREKEIERERDYDRERERDYDREREREREFDRERERNYNDRRREKDYNNYFEEGSKIIIRPDKLDIVMDQNYETSRNREDNKDEDMGYIKCYVEGYMYLKIRKNENK